MRAHLRRVTEQPPLKLDTSSEVLIIKAGLHIHTGCLKRFVGQPYSPTSPLSLKKLELLRVCGLTTLAHRDELLARKRRKRRRMMRERSLSPPATRGKRKASSPPTPPAPLTTPYSAEQMDSTPELREKKDFLLMFDLSHVSPQQRRGNGLFHSHTHAAHVLLCSFCTVVVVKNTTCSCILSTQGVGVGENKIKFVCTWRGGRGRSFVFLLQE